MKKWICLTLSLLMLTGALFGCKKKNNTDGDDTKAPDSVSTTDPDGSGEETKKELKFEDFSANGTKREFTMMVRNNRYHYLYCEKDDPDRIKSETFKRNKYIEDNFGIKFNIFTPKDTAKDWSSALDTSDGSYDLAVPDYWWGLEQNGYFINLLDRDELNFSDSYWYSGWNDNVTIAGKMYSAAGDGTLEILENIEVVFYNKTMAANQQLDMYSLVDSGKWTIDEMLRINALVSANLDDDDESNNVYGALYDVHSLRSQLFSAGLKLTEISKENGAITLTADKQQNINVSQLVSRLIHSPYTRYDTATARAGNNQGPTLFTNQKAMFYATALYLGTGLKASVKSFEYGIIPMPKYAEDDEYTSTTYGASPFAIPKSAKDLHCSAMILDAINYLSKDSIVNTMFEIVMKGQVAQQYDDARMIEFARSKVYVDFAWIYDGASGITVFGAYHKAVTNNTSVTSELESVSGPSQEALNKIMEYYRK